MSSTASSPSSTPTSIHQCVLISIDGWGLRAASHANAIKCAKTPRWDILSSGKFGLNPAAPLYEVIDASGLAVGLPRGVMGNSEVGHLTMGAGRVEFQDLVRINESIEEKKFSSIPTLRDAFDRALRVSNGRIHFLGLVSDGGVHSHISHLEEFLRCAKSASVPSCYVHFFADGRDTPPSSGTLYVKRLREFMGEIQYGNIATVMGRYYAMDRDKRWERIKVAVDALTNGEGEKVQSEEDIIAVMQKKYKENETDEFMKPLIVNADGVIRDDDTLVFIDFRSDRMREITAALTLPTEKMPFQPSVTRKNLSVVQMTQYDEKLKLPTLFPPQSMDNVLAEWISKHNIKQFHTAETEKYAHVTFFFAGGREAQFALEDREMIQSPKVATYDLAPHMSQKEVADSIVRAIESGQYSFIMANFAAPDMVGHTGVYDKTVIACESCDEALGVVEDACRRHGYWLVITADHGNAEEMEDEKGKPKTSHTTNMIPVVIKGPTETEKGKVEFTEEVVQRRRELDEKIGGPSEDKDQLPVAGLSSVAPTVLTIMGLEVPKEMTGKSLVKRKQ